MKWNVSQIIMIIFYSTGMVVWTRVGASFSWLGHSKFSFKNKHRESCSKIKPLIFARAACEILVKRCCEIMQSKGFLQRAERPRFNYLLLACSTVQDNGPGDLLSLRLKTRALFSMGQNFVRLRIISNDLRASLYWNLLHAIATCNTRPLLLSTIRGNNTSYIILLSGKSTSWMEILFLFVSGCFGNSRFTCADHMHRDWNN